MQNFANRHGLDQVLQKSLEHSNYSQGEFVPQKSSFNLLSNSKRSQLIKRFKEAKQMGLSTKNMHEIMAEYGQPKGKIQTFYTMMLQHGYIQETENHGGIRKPKKKAWERSNLKSELDSDFSDNDN